MPFLTTDADAISEPATPHRERTRMDGALENAVNSRAGEATRSCYPNGGAARGRAFGRGDLGSLYKQAADLLLRQWMPAATSTRTGAGRTS